jgi:uncharacterized protein DUF3108
MRWPIGLALGVLTGLLRTAAVGAEPPPREIVADYAVYAAGLTTARLEVRLDLAPASYQARLNYRTVGLFGALVPVDSNTLAQGLWRGSEVAPFHFAASGRYQGTNRLTVIDYANGAPVVRALVPDNNTERQPIPPALERNSVDTLSALVLLVRRVQETRRCETHTVTFDGRRLIDVTARTAGVEPMRPSARSAYHGPALRCDFEGRQIGGFAYGDDAAETRRPRHGSAWLARVVPGAPAIPVRLVFETRWFGDATIHLTAARAAPEPDAAVTVAGASTASPDIAEGR